MNRGFPPGFPPRCQPQHSFGRPFRFVLWPGTFDRNIFSKESMGWLRYILAVESKIRGLYPPKWMVYFMVPNPIKMDDLGGPPLFLETSIFT